MALNILPCMTVICDSHVLTLSHHQWSQFAFFRTISRTWTYSVVHDVVLPDEFCDLISLLKGAPSPVGETAYDYAQQIREQALMLGLDPEAPLAGKVAAALYRCAASYSTTPQALDLIQNAWGDARSDSAFTFMLGLKLKTIIVDSLLPVAGVAIDLRNYDTLLRLKTAEPTSVRECRVRDGLLKLYQDARKDSAELFPLVG